jgi:multiple sugar transport system substrate-binding protein
MSSENLRTKKAREFIATRIVASCLIWCFLFSLIVSCDNGKSPEHEARNVAQLEIWYHSGQEAERTAIREQAARFNKTHEDIQVNLTYIPERSYNPQVQAAALAGDLPDLLEFDGPYLYNYVWQGHLIPLNDLLSEPLTQDLIPSVVAQGTYQGHLYSVGTFDSGLAIYARRSELEKLKANTPASPADAWSVEEFDKILAKLSINDEDGAVLDLKLNYSGEWFTYAFSPIIQSAGGDLINREDYQSAKDVLNCPDAISSMRRLQTWIQKGYVDPNVDDAAFVSGRVALSWVGHWEYPRYAQAFGSDLIVLPLPDFGQGTRTGQGSWSWGITSNTNHPKAAAKFIEFLLQTDEVLAMTKANGAVPATRSAIAQSNLYGKGGPLRLFADQLTGGYSVPRPQSPGYPVITAAFQEAFLAIRNGADVKRALDKAVAVIDQDIGDNKGYPFR